MARSLDAHQKQELAAFVKALFDAAGYKTIAQWANESDYPASNLSDLRNAKVGVDGYNLLKLIRAAALRLNSTPEDLAAQILRATDDRSFAASVDHRLAQLSDLVLEALNLLRDEGHQQKRGAS